jgi:transposase InsO family protein
MMCRVLDVSRSGFFAWLKRGESRRKREDAKLLRKIREVFLVSHRSYGSPRIWAELLVRGWRVSRKRVARLMRQAGLYAIRKQGYRRWKKRAASSAAPNILQQDFSATDKNQKWLADIVHFATKEGWLHLAVVMDAFSRRIVGWSMNRRPSSRMTEDALKMALARRNRQGQLIHHSDRGSQYTATKYQDLLRAHQMQPSMSGAGNCYDNAMVESFFATLKHECANRIFNSINEARREIAYYIEAWYNRQRLHSSLGFASPMQYEEDH